MPPLKKLTVAIIILIATAQSASAAVGTSTNYSLDITAVTNSGATGSSANYKLEAGITGDNMDGKSASAKYRMCAGFIEETSGDCIAPSPPPPPPPPPPPLSGGGGSGPATDIIYPIPPSTQQTQATQVTQVTPGTQETEEVPPTQEIPSATQETQVAEETPPGQANHPAANPPVIQRELHSAGETSQSLELLNLTPTFVPETWCQSESCFGIPAGISLRPSAESGQIEGQTTAQTKGATAWWPWILALSFSLFLTIPKTVWLPQTPARRLKPARPRKIISHKIAGRRKKKK
jgi:hypothetical protein